MLISGQNLAVTGLFGLNPIGKRGKRYVEFAQGRQWVPGCVTAEALGISQLHNEPGQSDSSRGRFPESSVMVSHLGLSCVGTPPLHEYRTAYRSCLHYWNPRLYYSPVMAMFVIDVDGGR